MPENIDEYSLDHELTNIRTIIKENMDPSDFSSIPLHIDCFDDVSSASEDVKKSSASNSAVSLGGNHFQLRVLDRIKNEKTNSLAEESASFGDKIDSLSSTSEKVVGIIERYAKRIEVQKMKAIGVRNLVEGEIENRKTNKCYNTINL